VFLGSVLFVRLVRLIPDVSHFPPNNQAITDYKGTEQGVMNVLIVPCDAAGTSLGEDNFVEEPQELLGKPFHFKVVIESLDVNKASYSKGLHCEYFGPDGQTAVKTQTISGATNPVFNHSHVFSIPKLKPEDLEWFETGCLSIRVYAAQEDHLSPALTSLSTREALQREEPTNMRHLTKVLKGGPSEAQLKARVRALERQLVVLRRRQSRMLQLTRDHFKLPAKKQDGKQLVARLEAVSGGTDRFKAAAVAIGNAAVLQKVRVAVEIASGAREKLLLVYCELPFSGSNKLSLVHASFAALAHTRWGFRERSVYAAVDSKTVHIVRQAFLVRGGERQSPRHRCFLKRLLFLLEPPIVPLCPLFVLG
jgi:hypothetical protein